MTCALRMTVPDLQTLPRPSQTVSLAGRRRTRRGFKRYGTGHGTQQTHGLKSTLLPCWLRSQVLANFPRTTVLPQLPGVQGLPGPSVYGGGFAPTVESAAQAAAEGQLRMRICSFYTPSAVQSQVVWTHASCLISKVYSICCLVTAGAAFDIPGATRPLDFTSEEMLRDFEQHQGMTDGMQHFDNIFEQGRQHGRPHLGFRPPDGPQARLIEPCLQVSLDLHILNTCMHV